MRESTGQRRQIFGWAMYDWANSAYVTTVAVAVLPAYFASAVVPAGGWRVAGVTLPATALWGYAVGFSALLVFLLAPFLGAVADFTALKKRFLMVFCLMGSLAATLLFLAGPGLVLLTLGLFIVAQVGFVAGNVFYDAFLPHLGPPRDLDRISGKGFAYGYVGGGLQFGLSLGLIALHERLGLSQDLAARLAMATAGLWWGGFSLVTFARLNEPRPLAADGTIATRPGLAACLAEGRARVLASLGAVRREPGLGRFLLAFLFYNDGIQTVISMATIYGKEQLGFSTTLLMVTLLLIQIVAVPGALGFSALAARITARRALCVSLLVWVGITVYAYFMTRPAEYLALGVVVGLVLGGSQALSRSLYGAMIPKEASAEFFGYFSVINKFSSILGPLVFAVVTQVTGGSRGALLFLVSFFVLGLALLRRPLRTEPHAGETTPSS